MSTDLKARSKAYTLLRTSLGNGQVGILVGTPSKGAMEFSIEDIERCFTFGEWQVLPQLGLFDETIELLKFDLAQFAVTCGDGMELY